MPRTVLIATIAALAACGSSNSTTSPASCTTFTDLTATSAIITFGLPDGNAYVPRCAMVKVSQTITFNGDFVAHPLSQTSGAAVIPHEDTGTTHSFKIPTAGTYDYQCDAHHALGMTGTIKVVP